MKKHKFNREKFSKDIILKRVHEERLSIRKCAKNLGVHFSSLSRYERQEIDPNLDNLFIICEWLGCDFKEYIIELS